MVWFKAIVVWLCAAMLCAQQPRSHAPRGNASTDALIAGVKSAKEAKVAHDEDSEKVFLKNRGFSKNESQAVIDAVIEEEGHRPRSVWDFVQGITAVARGEGHQDARIALERKAGKLLDKVA